MSEQSGQGSDDNNKPSNVVPFPTDKLKKKKNVEAKPGDMRINANQKRTLFLSLLATVFIGTYLSSQLNKNAEQVMNRVGDRMYANKEGEKLRTFDEDLALAKKIGRDSLREPASQGRAPTADERLRDEFLKGRYKVVYQDGRIIEVELPGATDVEPVIADDRVEFIETYREALRVPAGEPSLVDKKDVDGYQIETYKIESPMSEPATIQFKLNRQQRLYWMHVDAGPMGEGDK